MVSATQRLTKIRMGMVGGGEGSFIGRIHRMAAALDGRIELVAGAFSSDPDRARQMGSALGLDPTRTYTDFQDMMAREAALPAGQRMQFVSVVTPNHLHMPVAVSALQAGFPVLCDKPLAGTLADAKIVRDHVRASGLLFGLTHTYAAYPMVAEARALVRAGKIGDVRRVAVNYPQGWLAAAEDTAGSKQAIWRSDPAQSGESGCFGDIGTHAHHLCEYITGLDMIEVAADMTATLPGRVLDDDGAALFRLENGARGTLTASQILAGEGNALTIAVHGAQGSLHWNQEQPDRLMVKYRGRPAEILKAGANCAYLSPAARARCRTPEGHPEGFIEAFATLYSSFAACVAGENAAPDFADVDAGVRGLAFVRAALDSSKNNSAWVRLAPYLES